ncbi:hypothetical protein BH18GEM1_BH18GEM1_20340 [soil metagenome]
MAGMPLTGVELFRSRLVVGCLLATVTRNLYWPMHSPGRDDVRLPDRVRGRLWWRPYLNGASTTGILRPEMGIRIYLWPAMDMVVVSRAGTPTDS